MKHFSFNILAALLLVGISACKPKGSSVVAPNHTPFLQAPGAFAFTRIDATDGVITLRWQGSARANSYVVSWGPNPGTMDQTTCEGATTSCVISGLTNDTSYAFSVVSTNPAGSKTINATAYGKPVGPFTVTSSGPSDESANISWSSSVGATSYTVRVGTSSGNYSRTISGAASPFTVSGLSNGVTYYFQVSAVNAENGRYDSTEFSVVPIGPPGAPSGLSTTATPGQVALSWGGVAGATSYKVYRGTTSGSYSQIATTTTTNYVDGGAVNGTTYYYMVRSNNGVYDSSNSNESSARPVSSFTLASATLSVINAVDVAWNSAAGADAYDIIYGTTSGSYTATISNVTSPHQVTGLSGGTTYYFRVRARHSIGSGVNLNSTNELSATPVGLIGPPTGLTIAANPGQAVLNWSAVSGASSYIIKRGTASGTYTTLASGVGGTTYTDTTANDGTTYFYVLQSFNGVPSVDSAEVSVRPIEAFTATSAVANSATSITVTWPVVTGAASYDLLHGTSASGPFTTIAGATSPRTLTGLSANTNYYFRVVARNAVGPGTAVTSGNTLSVLTPTAAPTGLLATATTARIDLAWTATTGAVNYEVFRGTSSGSYTSLATNVATNSYTDTTAANGTTYYYVVRASNGTDSANSNESSARPIAPVTISSATTQSSSAIQVSWNSAAGAATYDLRYGTVAGTYTTTLTNVTSPYTVSALAPNTRYYFMVVAKNAVGGGATINAGAEVNALTSFGAPSGLIAVGESSQNYVSWNPVAGASSYHLLRGTTSGSYTTLSDTITVANFTDTTAVNGTSYFYVVRANNGTDSANSNESSARPIAAFTVDTPTAATTNSLSVSWSAPTGAATYDLRYGTAPGVYTNTITNATSPRIVTGLASNTVYYFQVVAKNAIGGGATVNSTNESSAITALGAPSGVVATAGTGQITLNWSAVSGATSYHVLRSTTSGAETSLASGLSTNSYVDTTAADGTTYYYVVRANNGTDSANSAEVSGRPISTFNITSLTVASSSTLSLTWPAVTGASSYDVKYGTAPGSYTSTAAGVTSPYTLSALAPNTTYYVMVVAKNAVGSGNSVDANAETSATTSFGAPAGLAATATTSQISLTWTAVSGASTYHVLRGTSSGSYTSLATGVTTNAYNDTTAANGTTYYYVVRASNGTDSANSNEASARPIGSFAINAPSSITAASMSISWPAATGAATYDLRYGTASGSYSSTINNATSPYSLTGLAANTTYYVMVVAKNAVGGGATVNATAEVSAATATAAPSGLTAAASPGQVALSWGAVSGSASYHVLRGTSTGAYTSLATGVTGTSYNDTSAVNGTTYFYVVRSHNGVDSANSNEASARPIANFAIVSAVTNSNTQITLAWNAAAGATAYDVKYGTASGTYSTTLTNQTSPLAISPLSADTQYYFMVTARNTVGSGAAVDATAEASAKTAQGAPTIANFFNTAANRLTVRTSVAPPSGSTTTVLRGTSAGGPYTAVATGITSNNFNDNTVVGGTSYYYVARTNNGTDSANSNEVWGKAIDAFAVTSVTPTSASSVSVVWPAVAGAESYTVRYGTSAGSYSASATTAGTSRSITGLSAATTYYFTVEATNDDGTSGGSAYATNELSATTSYGAPTGLTASASPGQIQLNWAAVSGATSYNVYRGTASGSYTSLATNVSTNSYADATAANGTSYFYVVRAFNGTESANSNEASARPISAFTITSATQTSTTSISLVWATATGAATYDVRYGTAAGNYTSTATNQTSPLSITGLTPGQTYFFMVTAKNAVGSGTSIDATAEASATTPLGAPSGLVATASTAQVGLAWSGVAGATSYNVYRGTVTGSYTSLATGVSTTSYTDSTAANGTSYFYVVRAVKSGVESANSNEDSGRPVASFTIASATANSASQITLTWNAASGAATYDVKYGTLSGTYTNTLPNQTSPRVITGLSSGQTYYFMVTARNAVGSVGAAVNATAEVSTTTALGAPATLSAQAGTGQILLNWSSVASATSYHVLRGTTSGSYTSLATGVTGTSYTDATAANGTTYYYVVRSNNGTDSANSSEATGRPIAAFTIASAVATSSTQINVTWNAASGAATYDVKYGTVSGTYSTTAANVTSPFSVTGLTAGQTYYFMVTAKNAIGSGNSVNATSEVNAKTAVGAPTGVAAVATTSQVALSWGTVAGATSYHVLRGTTSGTYTSLATGVSGTSYTDATAANGTTYFYVVRANNGTDSANSSEVSARPIAAFTLASLTTTSATALSLTWNAATGAASYDVQWGPSSGNYTGSASGVTSPYSITGLTAGQTYYVSVIARNAVGSGAAVTSTNELSAATATGAPSGLVATATTAQVALTWTTVAGATSYNVYRGTTSGSYTSLTTGVGTNSYTDSTAANGTTYFYVVRASNGNESANSNEASARPIAAFNLTSVTPTSSSAVSVVYPAVTGAATYDVRYGTVSGTYGTTVSNTTSPQSITGLTAGQTYYFRVVAKNAVGGGATVTSTNEVSAVTALNAPSGVTATATTAQIALSWSSVVGATGYNIYRGTVSGTYSPLAAGVTGTSYVDSTAANGTTYYYVVRATNGTESANSAQVSGRPIASFSVTSAVATSTTSGTITWPAVTGAASYDIRYGLSSGSYIGTIPSVTSPYTATGLSSGQTYYFIVVAKNAVGSGASVNSSPESSVATPLVAPTGLTATPGSGQVALSWSAVSGATSYNVLRGTTSGSYTSLATGVTATTYTDATASDGTTYYYVVQSYKDVASANSSEVSGRPIAAFNIASATATSASAVSVSWSAVTGAATYDLRYGTVSGTYTTTLTNVTSPAAVTGLTSGQTYYFRLVAKNAIGSGASVNSTNEPSVTLSALPTISAITNKSMESDGSIAVTFTIADSDNTLNCTSSMTGTSSNTAIVPNASIVFSGTAPNCTATITPTAATTGSSTITLTVTDGTSNVNSAFVLTVNPCVVASIAWETQPTGMVAGNLFGTAPRVSLRKADNSLCMTALGDVTLDVADDNSAFQDAAITGTDTATPSGGYALFNAARMTRAGTAYTLTASQDTITSNESSTFNVTATTAVKLAWDVHPPSYDRLSVMQPNPVVRTADTYGNFTTTNTTIALSLQNNLSLATLSGTLSRATSSGAATFNNLSINNPQANYFIRATASGFTSADSNPFTILDIVPQNTVAVMDMMQNQITHNTTSSVYYRRALARFSNADVDGTVSWSFEIVARNLGTAANTVRLVRGSTTIASISVPASTPNPTYYSVSIPSANINATRTTYSVRVLTGNVVITSARVVAVQTNASRSVITIPLMQVATTAATPYYQTTSTTHSPIPDDGSIPWTWDTSTMGRVNELNMHFGYQTQTTSNSICVQLYNKTLGTPVGAELCATKASESNSGIRILIPGTTIPNGTVLEARFRSSVAGQWARVFNVQLVVNLVNIENMWNIQRVIGARTGLAANTDFPEHRARSRSNSFGSGAVDNFLDCRAKASTSGSATFSLRDHGSNTSGTASSSAITAASTTYTNQSSYTDNEAGPFATTNGNYVYANFARTSGSFDTAGCFWMTRATY